MKVIWKSSMLLFSQLALWCSLLVPFLASCKPGWLQATLLICLHQPIPRVITSAGMIFSVFPVPASFPRGNFIWWLQIFSSILCLPGQARGIERGPPLSSPDVGLFIFLSICTVELSVFSRFSVSFSQFWVSIPSVNLLGLGMSQSSLYSHWTWFRGNSRIFSVFIGTPKYLLF